MRGCKFYFNDSQSIVQKSYLAGPEIVDLRTSVGPIMLVIIVIFRVIKKKTTDMFY